MKYQNIENQNVLEPKMMLSSYLFCPTNLNLKMSVYCHIRRSKAENEKKLWLGNIQLIVYLNILIVLLHVIVSHLFK